MWFNTGGSRLIFLWLACLIRLWGNLYKMGLATKGKAAPLHCLGASTKVYKYHSGLQSGFAERILLFVYGNFMKNTCRKRKSVFHNVFLQLRLLLSPTYIGGQIWKWTTLYKIFVRFCTIQQDRPCGDSSIAKPWSPVFRCFVWNYRTVSCETV